MRCKRMWGRPYLPFLLLCGAGVIFFIWIQGHCLHSPFMAPLDTPQGGSQDGAPCLLARLHNINCSRLAASNVSYLRELADKQQWKESGLCNQEPLQSLLQDCDVLKKSQGYYRWPVTTQEKDFPLAFGLKLHHAPDMFERLLRVLWRPHNLYCIHVDSKTSPEVYHMIKNLCSCFDNIVLTEIRLDLVYLSVGSLLGDLECMRMALKSTVPWKYYLNLSGQEFPLKTNLEIVQILTLLKGHNDVESYLPTGYVTSWFTFKHDIVNGSLYMTKEKKEPFKYSIQIRKGSAYGSFSRKFLDFAINSRLAREFLVWLVDTMAPDEIFWATLNHLPGVPGAVQHPVSHRYGTMLSRAMIWQWDNYPCRTYVRGVCIFTASDLPWLAGRPELVANKFDLSVDPIVLDCLEQFLEDRTRLAFIDRQQVDTLNWTFYHNLPHLKDR